MEIRQMGWTIEIKKEERKLLVFRENRKSKKNVSFLEGEKERECRGPLKKGKEEKIFFIYIFVTFFGMKMGNM